MVSLTSNRITLYTSKRYLNLDGETINLPRFQQFVVSRLAGDRNTLILTLRVSSLRELFFGELLLGGVVSFETQFTAEQGLVADLVESYKRKLIEERDTAFLLADELESLRRNGF
jgi:hypothetical protein